MPHNIGVCALLAYIVIIVLLAGPFCLYDILSGGKLTSK